MASYTVPLEGGGSMTVNASSPQAAADNVRAQGGTPGGDASYAGGVPSGPGTGAGTDTGGTSANLDATRLILDSANQRAQQAYYQGMLQYNNDQLAFQKAQQAWKETLDQAGLTGLYQGAPTQAAMQYYANTFGAWGAPTAGQQTQAAQQQAFTQAQNLAQMYGQYYAPGQTPTAGMQTQQAQQQAFGQWAQAQQLAQQQWQQQQQASQNYLQLLSNLRGPSNYAQYMNVLGSTPQGLKDLVAAAAGQYVPGGGATTGVQPTPASLQSLVGDATGQGLAQQQQQLQAAQNTLVAPNQMAPQTWANLAPSQRDMLTSIWESQGYTAEDTKALFSQSLPRYATQATGAGSFRLQ